MSWSKSQKRRQRRKRNKGNIKHYRQEQEERKSNIEEQEKRNFTLSLNKVIFTEIVEYSTLYSSFSLLEFCKKYCWHDLKEYNMYRLIIWKSLYLRDYSHKPVYLDKNDNKNKMKEVFPSTIKFWRANYIHSYTYFYRVKLKLWGKSFDEACMDGGYQSYELGHWLETHRIKSVRPEPERIENIIKNRLQTQNKDRYSFCVSDQCLKYGVYVISKNEIMPNGLFGVDTAIFDECHFIKIYAFRDNKYDNYLLRKKKNSKYEFVWINENASNAIGWDGLLDLYLLQLKYFEKKVKVVNIVMDENEDVTNKKRLKVILKSKQEAWIYNKLLDIATFVEKYNLKKSNRKYIRATLYKLPQFNNFHLIINYDARFSYFKNYV